MERIGQYGQVIDGKLMGYENGLSGMLAEQGLRDYFEVRRKQSLAHKLRVTEAARLYANVIHGKENPIFLEEAITPRNPVLVQHLMSKYGNLYRDDGGKLLGLQETMSVTDYKALYIDVLDRTYYGRWTGYPIVNKPLVKIHPLRDFRVRRIYMLDGMVSPYLPLGRGNKSLTTGGDAAAPAPQTAMSGPVPQDGATFPTTETAGIDYQPLAYGSSAAVNWRALVNDDLGIFMDMSQRLAEQGARGIAQFITQFFFQSTGLNTNLITAGYHNQITPTNGALSTNPPVGTQGLMDALKVLAGQLDSSGQPILITGKMYLVHGPSQIAAVNNLMHAITINVSNEGGSQAGSTGFPQQWIQANNWVIQGITPIMDPYMPRVMSGAGNVAQTAWGLVVDPNSVNRPAVELGFLNGYEQPVILRKAPNTMTMGGGVDSMLGDWNSMDQELKIIGVMGGTVVDGRSVAFSTGAGV